MTKNVLIVDDDPHVADLYSDWLEGSYDTRTANDGGSALEMIDSDTDVVVLDRRMSSVSGDEVLERLRDEGLDCRVAV
ncbi:MAG: response regulator, partial [Halobacteria archaeon]|nr:response regulator [Halobacteria archaeon]